MRTDIPDKDAKLAVIQNKVLDKMKRTLKRESRLSTSGSVCSYSSKSSSRTRRRSECEEVESELASKISRPSSIKAAGSKLPAPTSQIQKSIVKIKAFKPYRT